MEVKALELVSTKFEPAPLKESAWLRRIARGVTWNLSGSLAGRLFSVAGTCLVARIVGPELFGQFGAVQITLALFSTVACFGLGVTVTKHVAECRAEDGARAGGIIGSSLVLSGVAGIVIAAGVYVSAPFIANRLMGAATLEPLMRIGAWAIIFGAVNTVQTSALAGFEDFRAVAKANCIFGALMLLGVAGGAYSGGVPGAIWGLVGGQTVAAIVNQWALSHCAGKEGVQIRFWPSLDSRLWRFSLLAFLGGLVAAPVNWVCASMMTNLQNGFHEIALFTAANQWRLAILFVPATIGAVFIPLMADSHSRGDDNGREKLLRANLLLNGGVAALVAAPIICFPKVFVSVFGNEFSAAMPVLVLLGLSAIVVSLNNTFSRWIMTQGRIGLDFTLHAVWAMCCLAASLLLIPRYGALGAALAVLVAAIVQGLCQWVCVRGFTQTK